MPSCSIFCSHWYEDANDANDANAGLSNQIIDFRQYYRVFFFFCHHVCPLDVSPANATEADDGDGWRHATASMPLALPPPIVAPLVGMTVAYECYR